MYQVMASASSALRKRKFLLDAGCWMQSHFSYAWTLRQAEIRMWKTNYRNAGQVFPAL